MTKKRKSPKAWIAGGLALLVGLMTLFCLYNGVPGVGYICHSKRLPLAWVFGDQGKARLIPGLRCSPDAHDGPDTWQPMTLASLNIDRRGLCHTYRHAYNYKQGASATNGDFKLDTLQDEPFFRGAPAYVENFSQRKAYCLDPANNRDCQVQLMPVCREPGKPQTVFDGIVGDGTQILTSCGRNDLRREIGLPRDDYEDMAGFALAEEAAAHSRGFRYSLRNDFGFPSGTVVMVEGNSGKLRCYYDATRHSGDKNRPATIDEGINTCMDILADPNRYCEGDGSNPGPNIY